MTIRLLQRGRRSDGMEEIKGDDEGNAGLVAEIPDGSLNLCFPRLSQNAT